MNNNLVQKLKLYKAKSEETTIYQHNNDLNNIQKQIKDIYNISETTNNKLSSCIEYHDIGKSTNHMQDILNNNTKDKFTTIRHEYHSASVKELEDDERIAILTHHKPFEKAISIVGNIFYPKEQKELSDKLEIEFEDITGFLRKTRRNDSVLKDLNTVLLKGYLNLCDHLASAGVKEIDKGLNTIEKYKIPNGMDYNSIQKKVFQLESPKDILIQAMTGLGKSATSLYWSDMVQNKEKSKRIYYILPFTASINSLYKDFVDRDISTSMLHSKAEYFLSKLIDKDEDVKSLYQEYKKSVKQLNICTIFQLLKAVFGCRRWEMLLAQMKNSIFIVDEIHCFDIKELCFILEMLKWLKENLGIYICIMSASIPTCMQKLIREKLNIETIITPEKYDLIIRHKIHRVNRNIIDDLNIIESELNNGKQVLICVNSVNLSQELYKHFKGKYDCKLIHGRFNTKSREKAEQGLKTSQLLIGTQSIEVSLDISYDVMFTEISPFDSLLQRFGRVNRKGERGLSNIHIYDDTSNVYNKEIINKTNEVLKTIIEKDNGIIFEDKTNTYLDQVYENIDMDTYNNYEKLFKMVINNLKTGYENESANEEMCDNDSISVLPKCLYNEYNTYINNKQYLDAQALLVNIQKKRLLWDKDNFTYDEDYKIYITNYKYTDDIGLDFTTLENNK